MKNQKILIYTNNGKKAEFTKSVNATMEKANDLIRFYNTFQPWKKIETLSDFEALCSDPLALFDKTLLANIDIKATGGKLPDPAVLASLFSIDRVGFIEAIERTNTLKTSFINSVAYLVFSLGLFQLNENAIEKQSDRFNINAESPEQIALYNHWQGLCKILNDHTKKYPIGSVSLNDVCKALKLHQVEGKFMVDPIQLSEQIKSMK